MIDWLALYSGYVVLLAFFTAFVGIAVWVYFPAHKGKLEQHRDIPFKGVE
jgi:cbb3-type cytochrome oxidase subunit 3